MTNQDIKEALIEYATEDTQTAIDNDTMCITDTKVGLITLNYENGVFIAYDRLGIQITEQLDRERAIKWLTEQYVVVQE